MPKKRQSKQDREEQQAIEAMQQDPLGVIRDLLGSPLWKDQEEIILAVKDNPRTAWRSSHGIGKTYICARLVLTFLYSFPYSIVLTTAPTWRQVEDLIWKEIRSAYNNSNIDLGGQIAPKSCQLSLDGVEWAAIGLSTNMPDRFQGYHAEHLLVVVDEAAGVGEDIFEAIEGVLTSEHCRLILIGNPTNIGGTFYRAFRESGWYVGHTSAFDTPNFTTFGITEEDFKKGTWEEKITGPLPAPYLITPAWAYDKYVRWGPGHPAYAARVVGDFAEKGENQVVPLSWIEKSMNLWQETQPLNTIE
jgi:hypothetical protein